MSGRRSTFQVRHAGRRWQFYYGGDGTYKVSVNGRLHTGHAASMSVARAAVKRIIKAEGK